MGCTSSVASYGGNCQTICFIGLDNSGKSRIIHELTNPGKPYVSIPTAGADYHELLLGSSYLRIFDMGGIGKYRELWPQFIEQSDGVVFVIDKTDYKRMSRVREEIGEIYTLCKSLQLPLLILANKMDENKELKVSDITSITQVTQAHVEYAVKECSAKTGEGLIDARDWLIQKMKSKTVSP